jgi:hypothetical protein
MAKFAFLASLVAVLIGTSCATSSMPTSIDARLIGEWQSERTLTQLGDVLEFRIFNKDGTFLHGNRRVHLGMTESFDGTFVTEDNKNVVLTSGGETRVTLDKIPYRIEDDILILENVTGSEVSRFKRKR